MLDPDPVTVPSDGELKWIIFEEYDFTDSVDDELAFKLSCQVRDRTREATLSAVQPFADGRWMSNHLYWCDSNHEGDRTCDCGLDDALIELRRAAEEARK
jgi:hypothetical protein